MAILEGIVRSANIAELRNHLTRYLKEVRAGEEIVVRDRQTPIAKIVPLSLEGDDASDSTLVASGLMRKALHTLRPSFWKTRRAGMSIGRAVAAVIEDREER